MTKSYDVALPHDPPLKVVPPNFVGKDLYPALTITAGLARVEEFADVATREDELGICLVAHFEVLGTLLMFYQSALDDKDHWTIFVDMVSCVTNKQKPTELGIAAMSFLTSNTIQPSWQNDEADIEYRARRRKPLWVSEVLPKQPIPQASIAALGLFKPAFRRPSFDAANDRSMMKVASAKSGSFGVATKKATMSKGSALKKAAAPAKKAAAAKKVVRVKKAAAAKK